MKHYAAAMLTGVLATLAGCHCVREESNNAGSPGSKQGEAGTAARRSAGPAISRITEPAMLPANGSYPEYCVYYQEVKRDDERQTVIRKEKPRVAILGIADSVAGGWTTAEDVVLSSVLGVPKSRDFLATSYSFCKNDQFFSPNDTLRIAGGRQGLTLQLTRWGKTYRPYPLSRGYTVGRGADAQVLWYQTGVEEGYQYFVYMENAPYGNGYKQRYWIESFRVGGKTDEGVEVLGDSDQCLAERPAFGTTVREISGMQCDGGGPQENGIGAGDEPKPRQ